MFGFDITFDSPWYLLLLLLLPLFWIFSYRTLSGMGQYRRIFALSLRSCVFAFVVLSLAEIQHQRESDKLTVLYLLDQSLSIPVDRRETMLQYVEREVRRHRKVSRSDRAGVIAFGREAAIEVPPFDDDLATTGRIESLLSLRQDATDLSASMKLALATFPEDSAKRVVIVTDGNENLGNAREMAGVLAQRGVSIYVVPVAIERRSEISVEKVTLPDMVRKGQPFDVRVVLNNLVENEDSRTDQTRNGTLQIVRQTGQHVTTFEQRVELPPGKKVLSLSQEIDRPDFYTYEAIFVPDRAEDDRVAQNNRASAFTHIRGQGHVLLIEDWENRGEFDFLVDRLRAMNLEVTIQGSNELFTSLAELQRYDTVVLANVPRTSGSDVNELTNFSDTQVEILVRNVEKMGCGLVMIGGNRSFGAGGWQNTELEKAMPVDFQIKNAKVVPVGALVMTMHASEMAQGNYWQKVIGTEALKALGPQDYCGIVHYGPEGDEWLWTNPDGLLKVGGNRKSMLARLDRMQPGDMPDFDPGMKLAADGFTKISQATVRHMIIISDGDPSPAKAPTIRALKDLKVKVTTVAVGTHGPAGSTQLQQIAVQTGGKYYKVTNPKALPRIYQKEAREVARPLVKEKRVQPKIIYRHEMLRGIETQPPPITGFVLTTVKEGALVEVSMLSPDPPTPKNATLLASWTYGLGRTVAFTSDAGKRWANEWTSWEYDKFFSQIISWSMRPVVEEGTYSVVTDVRDEKVRVILSAFGSDGEALNHLTISGSSVNPEMKPIDFMLEQTSSGRYVGEFDVKNAGSYFLTLNVPNPNVASKDTRPITIRAGVNVPYSSEFRDRDTNVVLLETLAEQHPRDGKPGKVIVGSMTTGGIEQLLDTDTFHHDLAKAVRSQDIWPWLMLVASCVFLSDVFIRRVTVNFYWLVPLAVRIRDFVLRREPAPPIDERLERLRSQKEKVNVQFGQQHSAARYEVPPDEDVDVSTIAGQSDIRSEVSQRPQSLDRVSSSGDSHKDTYTERLLKAKQKVWKDREK